MDGIGLITVILSILSSNLSHAAEQPVNNKPTIVYGTAATPDGKENVFVVEQPKGAPNPLGDPIPTTQPTEVFEPVSESLSPTAAQENPPVEAISPSATENPPAEADTLGREFRNTLMEANGMVYDVQAYPEQDFKLMSNPGEPQTIYSPNVNN